MRIAIPANNQKEYFYEIHILECKRPGLRHLLKPKIPTSRRNAVFFCQIFLNYMLCGVVFYVIIKYEDLV